ncbi:MAG: DUF3199 family protein [Oscillospiraceae bacterium]|nr:DUF3199 family protein [Oscillospiraceae bacterium]
MADRPWVQPQDVIDYTEYSDVKGRSTSKLAIDISRAEMQIMSYTNNKDFLDGELYPSIPEEVKNAVIILAEAFAHNAIEKTKNKKSETFDDYSYTAESSVIEVSSLFDEIAPLLEDYKKAKASNTVNMRLRKL